MEKKREFLTRKFFFQYAKKKTKAVLSGLNTENVVTSERGLKWNIKDWNFSVNQEIKRDERTFVLEYLTELNEKTAANICFPQSLNFDEIGKIEFLCSSRDREIKWRAMAVVEALDLETSSLTNKEILDVSKTDDADQAVHNVTVFADTTCPRIKYVFV